MLNFPILSLADKGSESVEKISYGPVLMKAFTSACDAFNRDVPEPINTGTIRFGLGVPPSRFCIHASPDGDGEPVPSAACAIPSERLILLNPFVIQQSAPQFVLQYLFWHELLHFAFPPVDGVAHHETLMYYDRIYRFHARAITWLREAGLPTMEAV